MRRGGWIRTKRIGRDDEEIAISKRNAIAKRKSNRKLVDRSTLTIRRKIEKSFIDDDDASNSFCRMRKPEAQRRLFPKFSSYRITSTSTLRRKRKNEKISTCKRIKGKVVVITPEKSQDSSNNTDVDHKSFRKTPFEISAELLSFTSKRKRTINHDNASEACMKKTQTRFSPDLTLCSSETKYFHTQLDDEATKVKCLAESKNEDNHVHSESQSDDSSVTLHLPAAIDDGTSSGNYDDASYVKNHLEESRNHYLPQIDIIKEAPSIDPLLDIEYWETLIKKETNRAHFNQKGTFSVTLASIVLAKNAKNGTKDNNTGFLWLPSILEGGTGMV